MEIGRKAYWNNKKYFFADFPLVRRCPHLTKRPLCRWVIYGQNGEEPTSKESLEVGSSLCNGLTFALHLFPRVQSDSFYAHLISFSAVLCSGAILSSSI